jgi:hypothetical protein
MSALEQALANVDRAAQQMFRAEYAQATTIAMCAGLIAGNPTLADVDAALEESAAAAARRVHAQMDFLAALKAVREAWEARNACAACAEDTERANTGSPVYCSKECALRDGAKIPDGHMWSEGGRDE